jgi:4-amino-4-deoxy-L-arabinose transferase-like glycosyltransferase
MITHRRRAALTFSTLLLILGQLLLVALGPMTRASGSFTRAVGIAIVAPDSAYYLEPAELSEILQLPWTRWGYPLLIALTRSVVEPAVGAVLLNGVAILLASVLLFRVVDDVAGRVAAIAAVSVLSVNPMTAQWVRVVLTESLFYALVVIVASLGIRLLSAAPRGVDVLALTSATILALISRPNGLLLAGSAATFLALASYSGRRRMALVVATWITVLVVLPLTYAATGPPAEGSVTQQLYDGVVVEGTGHVRVVITMPRPRDPQDESLRAGAAYAVEHPLATARLGVTRLLVETVQVRRHYPIAANLGFGTAIMMLLAAGMIGWRDRRAGPARKIFLGIALPMMALTAATFAVPEGRYGWSYLLPLAPIAALGVDRTVARMAPRIHAMLVSGRSAA